MKKIIMMILVLVYSVALVAQKTKPIIITNPSASFLKMLEQNAKNISSKTLKGLTANEKSFLTLVKTATTASGWDKAAYKSFVKNATPVIKSLGVMSDPDDGGEIFSDPDDGGEIFASSKLISKALGIVLNKVK